MALIKEDYGLVYNTDGSLCYTERTDDVPFQGVKSFAVEEATDNLLSSDSANFENNQGDWGLDGGSASATISTDWSMFGDKSLKVEGTNGNFSTLDGNYLKYYIYNLMDENTEYYAFSFYAYNPNDYDITLQTANLNIVDSNGDGNLNLHIIKKHSWKRIRFIIYYPELTGQYHLRLSVTSEYANSTFYIDGAQFEKKRFSTSFVDGNRPKGKKQYISPLFDKNNLVIAQWKKYTSNVGEYSLTRIGEYTTNLVNFYVYYGLVPNSSKFKLYNNGITVDEIVNLDNIIDKWVFEVLTIDGGVITYKIKGENVDIEIQAYRDVDKPYSGSIDYQSSTAGYNIGFISGLFIGEYKDKNGNVIWTDEYIKEVYKAKKPFNTNL